MTRRPFWVEQISRGWEKRSIIWFSGVRRVGKTTIGKQLPNIEFFNCDLPSTRRYLAEPEAFFRAQGRKSRIILDEIHRLENPSEILKIAADEFPECKILATGSSTLAATRKFTDSLTGRKVSLHLPPILWSECEEVFNIQDLDQRLFRGGLPEPLQKLVNPADFFPEWLDSFYARDIQELFGIRERTGFLNLLRLILRQSGGQADFSSMAKECGVSRLTIKAHLEALIVSHAVYPVMPFHGGGTREIVRRPKLYAFDTGFVVFERGWEQIRDTDRGILWEHIVLDSLRTALPGQQLYYWKNKSSQEIDFVVKSIGKIHVIECKINPDRLNTGAISAFRTLYPSGENILISPLVNRRYQKKVGNLTITFSNLKDLPLALNLQS